MQACKLPAPPLLTGLHECSRLTAYAVLLMLHQLFTVEYLGLSVSGRMYRLYS
jgi:hypothetical protein